MKFIFLMPDDMATLVEAYRVKRGHKATAIAVRELISTGLEVAGKLIGPIQVDHEGRSVSPPEDAPKIKGVDRLAMVTVGPGAAEAFAKLPPLKASTAARDEDDPELTPFEALGHHGPKDRDRIQPSKGFDLPVGPVARKPGAMLKNKGKP